MNTELLLSLQRWLRGGKEKAPDTREDGCGGEQGRSPEEETAHETQDHKSGRSVARDTRPPERRSISRAIFGDGRLSYGMGVDRVAAFAKL
jgi:hypothetical protein